MEAGGLGGENIRLAPTEVERKSRNFHQVVDGQ